MTVMQTVRRGAMAQPTAFSPASISGLQAWYDASQLTGLANGDPIASATDFSSNALHAAQATSSKRPTYVTGAMNSKPVIRFDGVDDELASAATAINFAGDVTAFVVANVVTPGSSGAAGSGVFVSKDNGTNPGEFTLYMPDTTGQPKVNRPFVANGSNGTSSVSGAAVVITAKISGTTTTQYKNGAANGTNSLTAGTAGTTPIRIGNEGGLSLYLKGDVAEVILYNAALGTTNQQAVEAYLKAKWGTP